MQHSKCILKEKYTFFNLNIRQCLVGTAYSWVGGWSPMKHHRSSNFKSLLSEKEASKIFRIFPKLPNHEVGVFVPSHNGSALGKSCLNDGDL